MRAASVRLTHQNFIEDHTVKYKKTLQKVADTKQI